MNVMTGHT